MRGAKLENSGIVNKIAIGVAAAVILGLVGLAVYGGLVVPPQKNVVKVLPDDRFAH